MNEIWKDIIGYEGLYQVSNKGNVKALEKYVYVYNNAVRHQKERLLIPDLMKKGYLRVVLSDKGKIQRVMVHRLVYSHFKGLIPEGFIINHLDSNKLNNNDWNLELTTNRGNTHHYRKSIKRDLPLGVTPNRKRFKAVINVSKKSFHLGTFDTPEEASKVYQNALSNLNNAL